MVTVGFNVVADGNLIVCYEDWTWAWDEKVEGSFRTEERKKAVGLGNGRQGGPRGSLLRDLASLRSGICSFIKADFAALVSCLL